MKCTVYGIQNVDYTNKEGRRVTGTNYHVTYKTKNVIGLATDKLYVSEKNGQDMPIIELENEIEVYYNKWGSIDKIELI